MNTTYVGNNESSHPLIWNMVEQNKWGAKISETNYIFVVISFNPNGGFYLKYIDAEMDVYDEDEKAIVRTKYNFGIERTMYFALKVMEHFHHYEWIDEVPDLIHLKESLVNQTSFDLELLKDLKEI